MKKLLKTVIIASMLYFIKFALWFRYRVKIEGLDKLNPKNLKNPGGLVFLPNHPTVFVDPTLVALAITKKFELRPIIVEYMYYTPLVHQIMRLLDAIPIPNNGVTTNSLKRKRSERAIHEVEKGLKKGQNFLIYPAGKVKNTSYETIGGASGVHQIVTETPEANVVLVRVTGLWGSSFSKAITGKPVHMFETIWKGFKHAFKNFIFFIPRREVKIEFYPAPSDFPRNASRLEFNRYLENWYNKPDGLSKPVSEFPGETLNLVSYSIWKKELPEIKSHEEQKKQEVDIDEVPTPVQEKVVFQLAKMTEMPPTQIFPEMELAADLGLDSLDISELAVFLEDQFDKRGVPVKELSSVSKVMAIAAGLIEVEPEEEELVDIAGWKEEREKQKLDVAEGATIPEVFFNNCERMGKKTACTDLRTGILTYSTLKTRVLILADYIKTLPGDHIGILLPSSVASSMCILAVQIAGKVPVMVNWTVGKRHLETVVGLSGVQKILTSWSFIDRLANVDLEIIEDKLLMLEDLRRELGVIKKIKGFLHSKRSARGLIRRYGLRRISSESRAVLLFTSGTESQPKGVPLSHKNILVNQRQAEDAFSFYSTDIILAILPPFHSFGFTITSLLPLLSGIRAAYSPDPTDGSRVAEAVERWGATLICGAPTFLKTMLKMGQKGQFSSLRYVVSGAEAPSAELFKLVEEKVPNGEILQGYGITECSPVITVTRPDVPCKGVGQPVFDEELLIVHPETHKKVHLGETGMILVRGPNVFSGYLNKDVDSPFVMADGKEWYQTGDLGFLDEMNCLTISGRLKRFIKVGAEMISLAAIENALYEHADKLGRTDEGEGPAIAVCAKEKAGEKPLIYMFTRFKTTVDNVNNALRKSGISNLVKITAVKHLKEIPLMGTGKVNYRQLEAKYISNR